MIYIYKIDDMEKLTDKIESECLGEIRNTFISYYDSLGWDSSLTQFSLTNYGPIIVFDNQYDLKKWLSFYDKCPFIIDMWILRTCTLYKFEMNVDKKLYTLFLNGNCITNSFFQNTIYQQIRYIKKYTGAKIRLEG